jgi:cell division septation protein DedD
MSKTYEFSFERGQLMRLIGGIVSLVLLVFSAGFLAGLALEMGQPTPVLIAQFPPAALPAHALIAPEDLPAIEPAFEEFAAIETEDLEALDPVESPEPAAPAIPGKYAVQLGAFLSEKNAGSMLRELKAKGYNADVVPMPDSQGRTWYLVRFGVFPNRTEASAVAVELQTREQLDALVRPSGSM